MRYTIISIDDSRAEGKYAIRNAMRNLDEASVVSVNGYDSESIKYARQTFPNLEPPGCGLNPGELGCWYSHMFCWKWSVGHDESLIVIEDDAIVSDDIDTLLDHYTEELPEYWDYICLHVPDNQLQDFNYRTVYDFNGAPGPVVNAGDPGYIYAIDGLNWIARTYQGYSTAGIMYSPRGAAHLLKRVQFRKIAAPVDIFIYQDTHLGNLDGYAHRPETPRPVVVNHGLPQVIVR